MNQYSKASLLSAMMPKASAVLLPTSSTFGRNNGVTVPNLKNIGLSP